MELKTSDIITDLERWQKAFLAHIQAISYSKNTIMAYRRILDQFIEYSLDFQEQMGIDEINLYYIINFLTYLENNAKKCNNLSKNTKSNYLKIISSFLNHINDNNDSFFNFNINFKKIKLKESKKEEKLNFLTNDEVERLLCILERNIEKKDNYTAYRNSFLVKLMLFAGLRISEALNIKLSDISISSDALFKIAIWGKGGKVQTAYIQRKIIENELNYFTTNKIDGYVFQTKNNRQLSRSEAFSLMTGLYKHALIEKQGLHILRHTLAMRLVAKGTNLSVIQKILRHSNINTTTIYAKATTNTIEAALVDDCSVITLKKPL